MVLKMLLTSFFLFITSTITLREPPLEGEVVVNLELLEGLDGGLGGTTRIFGRKLHLFG